MHCKKWLTNYDKWYNITLKLQCIVINAQKERNIMYNNLANLCSINFTIASGHPALALKENNSNLQVGVSIGKITSGGTAYLYIFEKTNPSYGSGTITGYYGGIIYHVSLLNGEFYYATITTEDAVQI
jgi:hypothetical protein